MSEPIQTERDVTKARIEKLIEKWVKPSGLGWWRIDADLFAEMTPRKG